MPDFDVIIIGSGIGGATIASSLAPTGARILMLEAGDHLPDKPINRNQDAIFVEGHFKPNEEWYQPDGAAFQPGNYYCVGGNSKFYGAVLTRFREEDFGVLQHDGGASPAWPITYGELEPWYTKAEQLYKVRGDAAQDPTEPPHSKSYDFPPISDEAPLARLRNRLQKRGYNPYSLPLGIDIDRWLSKGEQPWDAHPNSDDGKMDAETSALSVAQDNLNFMLQTNAVVDKLEVNQNTNNIQRVCYRQNGTDKSASAKIIILSVGAVQSTVLLLRSATEKWSTGLANSSDQVGRNFMNHNCSAVLGLSPWFYNDAIYQKTFGVNAFYLADGKGGHPLGNIQLLGRISGTILRSAMPHLPQSLLDWISSHAVDFYAMSEDLPNPESRVTIEENRIILDWKRSNWKSHLNLVKATKKMLKQSGFPVVLTKPFDRKTPSHQCGTIRMGLHPGQAPLDIFCRSYDHPNLFVVDASFLPTSAAVNPALTIAAQALRVGDHIASKDLAE